VYSHEYLVIISTLTLAYLSLVLTLKLPLVPGRALLPEQEKQVVLNQMYILSWFVLLLATIALGKLKLGGVYFVTVWNGVVFLGVAISYAEALVGAKGTRGAYTPDGHSATRGARFEEDETREDLAGHNADRDVTLVETEPATETTPLMGRSGRSEGMHSHSKTKGGEADSAIGWWLLQLAIVVPFPVILFAHIAVLLLPSLHQTLSDGSSPTIGKLECHTGYALLI
jgi:hypothetical protein